MFSRLILTIVFVVMTGSFAFSQQGAPADGNGGRKFFYEWKDREGGIHITDSLNNVPEEYRSHVRKTEAPKPSEATGSGQQPQPSQAAPVPPPAGTNDAGAKAAWQQRIRDWKGRLADAETRYHELEQERSRIYTGAFAWPGDRVKADEIEQKMKAVSQDITKARDMIQNVIPEEARKAGVPPGWLREVDSEAP